MQWLALSFPRLSLEALAARPSPSAVVARGRVRVVDPAAAEAGVCPGQTLSTALGLLPGLWVAEAVPARDAAALCALACWAGRFTPTVSLAPPDELVLEIGGCLRLFGGVEALLAEVAAGVAALGHRVAWAVAPTPLGARWLARSGGGRVVEVDALPAVLAGLPVAVTHWPKAVLEALASYGLTVLGEVRGLPAAALGRRIGAAPLGELARAWGDCPDPQRAFAFPEHFRCEIELPGRVEQAAGLVFAGRRLLAALAGWLAVRQLLLRAATLWLQHDDAGAATGVPLRFAEPTADEGRFDRLLREHLERLVLRGPVLALALSADDVARRPGESGQLFGGAAVGEGRPACLERLRARLGEAAVCLGVPVADHRPECATRFVPADDNLEPFFRSTVEATVSRPLWLLPTPRRLVEHDGRPTWRGGLSLMSLAERIESGWWDEGDVIGEQTGSPAGVGDVRRDYFVACNPGGQWAWIFRDADGWFLHGLFA